MKIHDNLGKRPIRHFGIQVYDKLDTIVKINPAKLVPKSRCPYVPEALALRLMFVKMSNEVTRNHIPHNKSMTRQNLLFLSAVFP